MAFLDDLDLIDNKGVLIDNEPDSLEVAQRYNNETELNPINAYIESLRPVRDEDKITRQKQIASFNALGQGLTNIIDTIYAGKGARVPLRDNTITNRLMQALTVEDRRFQQDERRFESAKLGQLIRDVNLEQKKADLTEGRGFKAGLLQEEKDYKAGLLEEGKDYEAGVKTTAYGRSLNLIEERNKATAARAESKRTQKLAEDKFPVTTGRIDESGIEIEAGISEAQYNKVIQYAKTIPNLTWDEATQKFLDGKGNKYNRDDIVTVYWKDIYDVDKDGNFSIKTLEKDTSRGGYLRDIKDKTYKSPTKVNTGGAY